jgi:hypothetical protein
MSVQDALTFISRIRSDERLAAQLIDAVSVVELGESVGLSFSVEELRAAHRHDWAVRWLLHHGSNQV